METSLVGHRPQVAQLEQDLSSGNLSHAYLFVGPPHAGKFTVAKWFAKKIMAADVPPERREETERQIDALIHPDVLVLDRLWMDEAFDDLHELAKYTNVPQQHRIKGKMKTDVISIDDVRLIQERVQETGMSPHRVCLIRSVGRMRDEAANAFLKTLEEPPPGRVFLLTADAVGDVLPTISSRCRVVRFERVGDKDMRSLVESLPGDEANFILRTAQGSPGLAMRLKSDPEALRLEQQVHARARSVWTATSLASRLHALSDVTERGPDADRFLRHLFLTLRDSPLAGRPQERALMQLVRDLETNAHRTLIVQRFALSIVDK